jgi:hypothetical protein
MSRVPRSVAIVVASQRRSNPLKGGERGWVASLRFRGGRNDDKNRGDGFAEVSGGAGA